MSDNPAVASPPQPAPQALSYASRLALENTTIATGRVLRIARLGWMFGIALYAALFVFGLRPAYERALILEPETTLALAELGIPAGLPAQYWLMIDSLTFLGFTAIALFIVLRRPNDWLVMITSLMMVGTAALYTAAPAEAAFPIPLTALAFSFAEIFQLTFLFLFPNGKFVPRWMVFLLAPLFIWRPLIWGLVYLPGFYTMTRTGENYGTLRQDALDTGVMLLLFVIGVVAQIYRYHRVSTPIQKQQTKWLLFGMICAFLVAGTYVVTVNVLGLLEDSGTTSLFLRMIGRTVRQLAFFLLPLTLAFSILRYRLWDIDLILQRTLVYAPLTAILAGLFAAIITFSESISVALIGQKSIVATVVTTLLVAAAVEPLQRVIQDFVDNHFKSSPDPQARLKEFGERVQLRLSTVEPQHLIRRFSQEATSAFQAQCGAAYIVRGSVLERVYPQSGWRDEDAVVTIPLLTGRKRIGAIALGERPYGRQYERTDLVNLGRTATIIAVAIEQDTAAASTS
jgi:hypothetical protein